MPADVMLLLSPSELAQLRNILNDAIDAGAMQESDRLWRYIDGELDRVILSGSAPQQEWPAFDDEISVLLRQPQVELLLQLLQAEPDPGPQDRDSLALEIWLNLNFRLQEVRKAWL